MPGMQRHVAITQQRPKAWPRHRPPERGRLGTLPTPSSDQGGGPAMLFWRWNASACIMINQFTVNNRGTCENRPFAMLRPR